MTKSRQKLIKKKTKKKVKMKIFYDENIQAC